jgi:DNA polymerase III alpha subunit
MKHDQYGQSYAKSSELCELLYQNPALDLSKFMVEDPDEYNCSIDQLHAELKHLKTHLEMDVSVDEYHQKMQSNWRMPKEYQDLDIAKFVLDQCKSDHEMQRVGQELLLYQERNLFDLLKYLKYLVDLMRKHNIVWGVGRGSSVASYVLFLIGIHKIDSLYYNLDVGEFLK